MPSFLTICCTTKNYAFLCIPQNVTRCHLSLHIVIPLKQYISKHNSNIYLSLKYVIITWCHFSIQFVQKLNMHCVHWASLRSSSGSCITGQLQRGHHVTSPIQPRAFYNTSTTTYRTHGTLTVSTNHLVTS